MDWTSVQRYLIDLVPERPAELVGMEERAERNRFPIIGPAAGHFCYLLARVVGARSVFEMGSGFGYSTAWFARAVTENGGGVVHHVVWDEELSNRARVHLERLGYGDLVRYHVGEAVETLAGRTEMFDVVFCDIDKADYPAALPVIAQRLREGGMLIADNLLWNSRIFDDADRSEATEGIRSFTRAVVTSPDWIATVVPIRDGLLFARKNRREG